MSGGVIGSLMVHLGLNAAEFEAGLNKSRQKTKATTDQVSADFGVLSQRMTSAMRNMGRGMIAGLGAGATTMVLNQLQENVRRTVRAVASIGDEAKRAGMSSDAFQEWAYVAQQNRIEVDAVIDGLKELNLRSDEFIQTGGGAAAEAFGRLGISASDLAARLGDPSELMLEIIGRLERMDKAAQIRIMDELLGGTGGERFVELIAQGEDGIRALMERGREFGVIMDEAMIAKADELDRRWQELTTRISSFGKTLAVALADLPLDVIETRVDELFGDERRGRSVLGDGAFDDLRKAGALTDEQVKKVEDLRNAYQRLSEAAMVSAAELTGAAVQANSLGNDALWAVLAVGAQDMRELARQFDAGEIAGGEFAARMQEIQTRASDALAALEGIDAQSFSGVIANLGGLGRSLSGLIERAREFRRSMPGSAVSGGRGDGAAELAQRNAEGNTAPTAQAPLTSPRPQQPGVDSYGDWLDVGEGAGGQERERESPLDRLITDLQTDQELLADWYAQSLDLLNASTEEQLAALGGRHAAIERLEQEHQDRMRQIEAMGQALSLEGFLGGGASILGAMGAFNKRALKLSQTFAAAEALVSTYKGAAKELERGTFGFASAAAVIARGLAFVATIKSINADTGAGRASGGGAGAAGGGASAPVMAEAPAPLDLRLVPIDPNMTYGIEGRQLRDLFEALQSEAGKRGIQWSVT